MFFEKINITPVDLEKLLGSDIDATSKYIQLYVSRRFYIGDTQIARKTLTDWKKAGLLPYPNTDEGWQKFSFVEWVWLECINEFRQLGVSVEKIKKVKSTLFDVDPEEVLSTLKNQIETYDGEIDKKEIILSYYNDSKITDEMRQQAINESQLGPFTILLSHIVLTNQNYCIVYNNKDFCSFFLLGAGNGEARNVNEEVFSNLIDESFLVINLRKIVNKLFQKPYVRHNDNFVIDFLSPKERKIFDEIRGSNAKEIIIKFNDGNEPTHIQVKRNQISNEVLNKVARYLKAGHYQTIEFTTRNGKLIKYEEQDSIKLE